MKRLDLSALIHPVSPQSFLEAHWEREPLVLTRGEATYFADILTMADVDRLVTTQELRAPGFRMVRNGRSLRSGSYTRDIPWSGGVFDGLADLDRVFYAYEAGATLVLQALHRRWRPLADLCRGLEEHLRHPCQANVYLTPPGSRGLAPHADAHDVFVLQHHGTKHWRIWDSPVTLPLARQAGAHPEERLGPPLRELILRPGDLIYLPRGWVHVAGTEDEPSLHTTIGILTLTWGALLRGVMQRAMEEEAPLRRGIPPALLKDPAALSARLAKLVASLQNSQVIEHEARHAGLRFVLDREPHLTGHLLDLGELHAIELDTTLRRRPGVLFHREEQPEADTVSLSFHGKRVVFPSCAAAALRQILSAETVTPSLLSDELDDESKLVLARRLVREGFLTAQAA